MPLLQTIGTLNADGGRVKIAILAPMSELLVADEVDVWPGFGDEGVGVCVGEAAEGVGAGGRQVRPPHRALHGV